MPGIIHRQSERHARVRVIKSVAASVYVCSHRSMPYIVLVVEARILRQIHQRAIVNFITDHECLADVLIVT